MKVWKKMFSLTSEWLVQHESISSYTFQKQVYGYHHGLNNLHRNMFLSIVTNNFVLHSVFFTNCPINSPIKIIFARKKYLSRLPTFQRHILGHMANSLPNTDKKIFLFWNDSELDDTRKSCYQNMPQGSNLFICRQLDIFTIKYFQAQNNGLPCYVKGQSDVCFIRKWSSGMTKPTKLLVRIMKTRISLTSLLCVLYG